MQKIKKFSSLFSVCLIFSVIFGNFSLPVLAYEKNGVNFEQVRTGTPLDDSVAAFNKINSVDKLANGILQNSAMGQREKTGLEKSQQIEGKRKNYVEGEILVKYKNIKINLNTASGRATALNFTRTKSLEKKEDLRKNNISVLRIKDTKTVEQKIAELKNDPNVEYAQPNYLYYPTAINTNDTSRAQLWALENIGQTINGTSYSGGVVAGTTDADIDAPEAWAINEGTNAPIIVAVIDTGVAYNHPDLINNMWNGNACVGQDSNGDTISGGCMHGFDFIDNDKIPLPTTNSHGTYVSGTIGAVKDNDKGIIGVAPNVKIMALKVDLPTGGFPSSATIAAINFAEQNGAEIINASFGGSYEDLAQKSAIASFTGIFVAAAGNKSTNNESAHSYPSDYNLDNIISVAATDQNDSLATFSNYGITSVDVGAPGVNILSTVADSVSFSENFETSTLHEIGTQFTAGGNTASYWGVEQVGSQKALFTDDRNLPYISNENAYVESGNINLAQKTGAKLDFNVWCDTESTPAGSLYDFLNLKIYNGSIWTILEFYHESRMANWVDSSTLSVNGYPGYLYSDSFNITPYLSANNKIKFEWFTDLGNWDGTHLGCFVDNIKITSYSDGSDEKYGYLNGTSMAAPHVAGLAALIEGYNPNLTSAQVKNIILTTGDDISALHGKTSAGTRINAQKALQAVNPAKAITTFTIPGQVGTTTINETVHTIAVTVPFGTAVTSLVPTITITGASVSPLSGVANNFTATSTYTVTAADGLTQAYVVTLTIAPATNYTISGTIKYYDGVKIIPNATVILENGVGAQIATTTTNASGSYQFTGITSGGDYVVRVSKNDNASGLSSNDQIKIGRHIVGLEFFSTIYKTIAGDVNNSGGLTSNDQIKIGRFIVGLDSNLPSGAWKFYSSSAILNTTNYLTFGLTRTYTNLVADTPNQDFVGVKMGDVNNSWVSN